MKLHYALLLGASLTLIISTSQAQVLNKLKNKGDQKAGDAIDKLFGGKDKKNSKEASNSGTDQAGNNNGNAGGNSGTSGGSNNPSNTSGGGLISTPPDVKQNLTDAETSYKAASYGEARYALQQAMLGVELEIGNQILKSLPETISGLNKVEKQDQVTSTGAGWEGLTIQRVYNGPRDKPAGDGKEKSEKGKKGKEKEISEGDSPDDELNDDGKQLKVIIANNAMWMSSLNMYFSAGGYAQTTGGEQNWKQTKVKGNRAIIEYNEGSGYKLSVPIGQSSLIVYEGVNFATEPDMMKAAEALDIDGIKKMLGEQ